MSREKPSWLSRAWSGLREATRRYFVAGLLVFAPVGITIWAMAWIVQRLDNLLLPRVMTLVLPGLGWRGPWLLHAGLTAVVLVVVLAVTRGVSGRPNTPRRISTEALLRPGPWLLAAAFGCYTIQFFAVATWLPSFLVESHGRSRETAALAGGLVVAATIAGCLAGAWLLHRNVARWKLLAVTYLVMAPCAAGAFSAALPPVLVVALAAIFSAVGGLLPAAILAGTAVHAPSRDHVATVNGFVVQGSHVGVVIGPPVFAMFVAAFGSWEQGWMLMAALGIAGLGVTAGLRTVERREGTAASR